MKKQLLVIGFIAGIVTSIGIPALVNAQDRYATSSDLLEGRNDRYTHKPSRNPTQPSIVKTTDGVLSKAAALVEFKKFYPECPRPMTFKRENKNGQFYQVVAKCGGKMEWGYFRSGRYKIK